MRKKITIGFIAALFAAALAGCNLFGAGSFTYDMRGSAPASSRSMSDGTALCELSKLEVELDFLYVRFQDGIGGTSQFTLINEAVGQGYKIDLVSQKLSDVVPASVLAMANASSAQVDKIWMGFAPTATVCGYTRDAQSGIVYRTDAAGGVIADDGSAPTDCSMAVSSVQGTSIPGYSVDPANPPVDSSLTGLYLWLIGQNCNVDYYDMFIPDGGSFEFVYPTHMALVRQNGAWKLLDMDYGFPYVPGSSEYYEYYLKKTGSSAYTDYVRVLLSSTGNLILGQGMGTPHTDYSNSANALGNGGFYVWYNADDDPNGTQYPSYFKKNADGSVWMSNNLGSANVNVTFPALQLASHSGIVSISGSDVGYDALLLAH